MPARTAGGVQAEEPFRAELGRFLEEMALHQLRVLLDGLRHGQVDDALGREFLVDALEGGLRVVDEDATAGAFAHEGRALDESAQHGGIGGSPDRNRRCFRGPHAGEAPGLVAGGSGMGKAF